MVNSKISWLGIAALASLAAFLVMKHFFPDILEKMVAGIIAFLAFLVGLFFRRKKTGT